MRRVVLSELAESDLTDIWVFIARDNPETADRFIDPVSQGVRRADE